MKTTQTNLLYLTASVSSALLVSISASYGDTLQGGVDQTSIEPSVVKTDKPDLVMPTPVLPAATEKDKLKAGTGQLDKEKALKGSAKDDTLTGNVEDEGDIEFRRRFGHLDNPNRTLNASAQKRVLQGLARSSGGGLASQDPDYGDKELAIAWDKWRNRFLWSVQSGVTQYLNDPNDPQIRWDPQRQTMVSKFPMGTIAWFSCKISNDRKITELKILHSSGFPKYDQAVLNSVRDLNGSAILKFPGRSRRLFVAQNAGIKTATNGQRQFFKFGDVERYKYRP